MDPPTSSAVVCCHATCRRWIGMLSPRGQCRARAGAARRAISCFAWRRPEGIGRHCRGLFRDPPPVPTTPARRLHQLQLCGAPPQSEERRGAEAACRSNYNLLLNTACGRNTTNMLVDTAARPSSSSSSSATHCYLSAIYPAADIPRKVKNRKTSKSATQERNHQFEMEH